MTRACGECTLCCRLIPVRSKPFDEIQIDKNASCRCVHQRHGKGCAVYDRRPLACRMWSCGWLQSDDEILPGIGRPDRCHYVIDPIPDYITMVTTDVLTDGTTAENRRDIPVLQVWVDPYHRDAHQDPALRAFLDRLKRPAIVRYSSKEGFVLFPPSVSSDNKWHEHVSECIRASTPEQITKALQLSGAQK